MAVTAAGVTGALVLTACGSETPDYQSIWSTSATTTASSAAPTTSETPVPLSQYLEDLGVQGEPIALDKLTDLTVTLPRPTGWTKYSNSNFAPQSAMIAKNDTYPTAMVMVFRLQGGFDVPEAIKHANADAQLSPGFTKLNESLADFEGFPSAMIEGSYNGADNRRLHSYSRIVIPVTPAPAFQRYLVQFTVTSLADRAVADSDDVEAVIDGFKIAVK